MTWDRDVVIEAAAKAAWDGGSPLSLKRWDQTPEVVRRHSVELEDASLMVPAIVASVTAELRVLIDPSRCAMMVDVRRIRAALDEIDAAAGVLAADPTGFPNGPE